jgi:hypothetical protein
VPPVGGGAPIPEQQHPASRKVVFIASLGHSGSTLLDLILGGHSAIVGLGEVGRSAASADQASDHRNAICSCGRAAPDCPFWGEVLTRLASEPAAGEQRRYEIVLDTFNRGFGPDRILVDSSKYLRWLSCLAGIEGLDLRVLFLIRDVRSFAISAIDNVDRKRAAGRSYRATGGFAAFRRWHQENRKTARFLATSGLPFMRIGYEELCLAPEHLIPQICHFLDIPFEPSMLELARSSSHIVRGNRMRHDGGRRRLAYDPRWLVRNEWMLPALCCPGIMRCNRQQVYSNGVIEEWRR